jgi:hypothetical protein
VPVFCCQEDVLWYNVGEPEFQVLLRISLFDLPFFSGKEDLDGISFWWGHTVLIRAAELSLLLSGCVIFAHTWAVIALAFSLLSSGMKTASQRHLGDKET